MRAPRGPQISCRGWEQEATLRLLVNTFDPEVAGGAAGTESIQTLAEALQSLANDQTLIVRGGKLFGKIQSSAASPRVLILNQARSVPAPSEEDRRAKESLGSILLGEPAAAGLTSAGAQSALCGAFMTLACAAEKQNLTGKLVVAGGMGSLGGVTSLAAIMNGAAFLGIEVDEKKIQERIRAGYCDICVNDLDEAQRILKNAIRKKEPVSVGLVGNCAEVIPEMAQRGVLPDILTDLTGASDPLNGYRPAGMSLQETEELRRNNPQDYRKQVKDSMARHAAGLIELGKLGAVMFDFGNGLGGPAIPHFVSEYLEPLIRAGVVPLRWFALSGERSDIHKLDNVLLEISPLNEILARWLRAARKHLKFQGLPARVAWLGTEEREEFGERVNTLVANGEIKAPVVLAREALNSLPISVPVEAGESATSARPIFDALQDAAPGASWASWECVRDRAFLSTQAVLANGTPQAARPLSRVLGIGPEPA